MPEAIVATEVIVERGGRRVLDAVNLVAAAGKFTAIVGPNGAGKSTLLWAIAGVLPYTGSIRIDGHESASLTPRERARLVAFVPQQTQLRAPMPVRDVVAQGRYARGQGARDLSPQDVNAVERAIAVADLTKLADRPFTELSGGEQRRVLVARALATEARVLLFDEPTASLDVRHGLALYRLATEQVAAGVAVVMVLHQLADALRFADHALLLHEGRVVAAGRPSDVMTESTVRDVYGVRMIPNSAPSFDTPSFDTR